MNRERLQKIRNWQSHEFYAALVIRPLTIAVMMVVADWRWLTPNRVTIAATIAKFGACGFIYRATGYDFIYAAGLLQLGLLLDHLDGTIARYRNAGSSFGGYLDKIGDAISWAAICLVIGWVAYRNSGDAYLLILAALATYGLLFSGYAKWLWAYEDQRLRWRDAEGDPAAAVERENKRSKPAPPPQRSLKQWIRWALSRLFAIVRFEEVDLFFWIGLFLVLKRLDLLLWGLALTQAALALSAVVYRGIMLIRIDAQRRRAE